MGKLYKRGDTYYADYFDRVGRRQQRSTRTGDIKVARARLRDMELNTTDQRANETEAVSGGLGMKPALAHRDLKPANMNQCRTVVIDVARVRDDRARGELADLLLELLDERRRTRR